MHFICHICHNLSWFKWKDILQIKSSNSFSIYYKNSKNTCKFIRVVRHAKISRYFLCKCPFLSLFCGCWARNVLIENRHFRDNLLKIHYFPTNKRWNEGIKRGKNGRITKHLLPLCRRKLPIQSIAQIRQSGFTGQTRIGFFHGLDKRLGGCVRMKQFFHLL